MSAPYFIAALVIAAVLYWVLYRLFVPAVIRNTTARMREWADASKAFTEALAPHVKIGDEVGAAREKLERLGFTAFVPAMPPRNATLRFNRNSVPFPFGFALPLTKWLVETEAEDGVHVSAIRGVVSR